MQSGNSQCNEKLLEYSQNRLHDLLMCKPIVPSNVQEYDRQLTEKQGEGFKKFELLWQLTPSSQQEPDVGFEKTVMKMFDALSLQAPIRSVVVKWLQDSFLRGDITALMKPLLKILLSLQTKRISLIQAVALRKGENGDVNGVSEKDGGALERKISKEYEVLGEKDFFAVSAVDDSALGVKYRTEAISGKKKSPRAFTKIFGVPIIPKGNFVKSPGFGHDHKKSPMTPIPTTSSTRSSCKAPEDDPNMSLIVNPLENSSDFDSVDVDEYVSLSSSAPTQSPGYLDQSTGEMSRKHVNLEYSVSSSDSDISDTEGPGPYSSLPTFANETNGTVKRYSGHCEKVDEKLRVYDKIKNRKTYKLKKDDIVKDDGDDKSLTEMSIRIRQAETAPNYDSSREPSLTSSIRDEGIDSLTKDSDFKAISDPDFKASEIHKRLSCSSKQSTDSNNSSSAYSSSNRCEGRASSVDPVDRADSALNVDNKEASPKHASLDDELVNMTPKTKLSALKSKTPELRRKKLISTEMNWEKTKEKFEKSKLNLEILRQNIMEENLKLEKVSFWFKYSKWYT